MGMIRTDYNNRYNFSVQSNKELKIFMDGQLVLAKPSTIKEERYFFKEMWVNQLVAFEVHVQDWDPRGEYNAELGYLVFQVASGNQLKQLVKPKNMFSLYNIQQSGTAQINIIAGK